MNTLVKNRTGKMSNKYDTYSDLDARLGGTIVRYKDRPFFVSIQPSVGQKGSIHLYKLGDLRASKTMKIKINDPELDISSIELGYYNLSKDDCAYAIRQPARRYKQGIYPDNVIWRTVRGTNYEGSKVNIFHRQEVFDGLCGIYPLIREALTIEKGNQAISPDVAIENIPVGMAMVYLKTSLVGYFDKRWGRLILRDDLNWASEKYVKRFDWRL